MVRDGSPTIAFPVDKISDGKSNRSYGWHRIGLLSLSLSHTSLSLSSFCYAAHSLASDGSLSLLLVGVDGRVKIRVQWVHFSFWLSVLGTAAVCQLAKCANDHTTPYSRAPSNVGVRANSRHQRKGLKLFKGCSIHYSFHLIHVWADITVQWTMYIIISKLLITAWIGTRNFNNAVHNFPRHVGLHALESLSWTSGCHWHTRTAPPVHYLHTIHMQATVNRKHFSNGINIKANGASHFTQTLIIVGFTKTAVWCIHTTKYPTMWERERERDCVWVCAFVGGRGVCTWRVLVRDSGRRLHT